jgi:hypothetical protein
VNIRENWKKGKTLYEFIDYTSKERKAMESALAGAMFTAL